jgi:hypothetical protein
LAFELVTTMAEGNPANHTDLTSGGHPITVQISEAIAVKNKLT